MLDASFQRREEEEVKVMKEGGRERRLDFSHRRSFRPSAFAWPGGKNDEITLNFAPLIFLFLQAGMDGARCSSDS